MKSYFLLLVYLLVFSGCAPTPPHIDAADDVMNSFSKKMKKEGFSLCGSGGAMMDDIQEIMLDYETHGNLKIDEVRMIFVKKAEELLSDINSNLKIRPYLHDYPFTAKNVFLNISFHQKNGEFVDPPYIAYVFIITDTNRINYSVFVIEKEFYKLKTVYEEPYEDALKIYNETLRKQEVEQESA